VCPAADRLLVEEGIECWWFGKSGKVLNHFLRKYRNSFLVKMSNTTVINQEKYQNREFTYKDFLWPKVCEE